jgi:hypothetical protein
MFIQFKSSKLPEYEVITPQTKNSFTVQSMSVATEENLKGSFIVSIKMIEHLNKCIFESIAKRPPQILTYEDFLNNVTTIDRGALLYGLYHITYGDIRNYDITCSSCDKIYPVTIKASETFHIDVYPGDDDILKKIVKADLEVFPNVVVYIKQPTLNDELQAFKTFSPTLGKQTGLTNDVMVIERIEEIDVTTGEVAQVCTEKSDILNAYKALSPKDRRIINDQYNENFGKYSVNLKMMSTCQFCGHVEEVAIDLVAQFLSMVYTS